MMCCVFILKKKKQLKMHIKKVRESQEEILRILKESSGGSGGSAFRMHMQEQTPERHIINGRNVMLLHVYSFGLKLLDMLFSREELSESIVYKSRRPPLNKKKVPKLPIKTISLLYIALLYRWTNL